MILGIGSDIVDITRVERTLERFGERFVARCFTDAEREISERRSVNGGRVASYAKRYAAKEACAKALGTGLSRGVFWREIGVENDAHGRPCLRLSGGALARLQDMLPDGMAADVHLSLSDEPPMAQAFVIISARPSGHLPDEPLTKDTSQA